MNMITPMTEQIQATILAVQTYKKWLYYDSEAHGTNKTPAELWGELEKYFRDLPLPSGLTHSRVCFEAILSYPINETIYTEPRDLPEKFTFGY